MRKFTQLLFMTVAIMFSSFAIAQSNVSGTVVGSELNAPLLGANVLEKGTTNGTQTDFDGFYSINTKKGDVLVYSFVGMKTTSRKVGQNSIRSRK